MSEYLKPHVVEESPTDDPNESSIVHWLKGPKVSTDSICDAKYWSAALSCRGDLARYRRFMAWLTLEPSSEHELLLELGESEVPVAKAFALLWRRRERIVKMLRWYRGCARACLGALVGFATLVLMTLSHLIPSRFDLSKFNETPEQVVGALLPALGLGVPAYFFIRCYLGCRIEVRHLEHEKRMATAQQTTFVTALSLAQTALTPEILGVVIDASGAAIAVGSHKATVSRLHPRLSA